MPLLASVQRNHALEHATIHVLREQNPYGSLFGRSDWNGFSIIGNVDAQQVEQAAQEALARLRAGETELAIHPFCGTGLAISGLLSGLAAFLALAVGQSRRGFRWSQLPQALVAAILAAMLAQPLGILVQQRVTTTSRMGVLRILRVNQRRLGTIPSYRVETG